MRSFYCIAAIAALTLAGCSNIGDIQCSEDSNCDLEEGGICRLAPTNNRWCTYPDRTCPGGYRYSDFSTGDDLRDVCVESHTLTVQTGGTGTGEVASDPPGLTCSGGACTGGFPVGTTIRLSAAATSGSFLGWIDGCRGAETCEITLDNDRAVGALFGTPGEALWAAQFGTDRDAAGKDIAIDSQGNIIVVGNLQVIGGPDPYIVKLDGVTGNVLWSKHIPSGPMLHNTDPFGLAVDEADNIYIGGRFTGVVNFGGGPVDGGKIAAFALKLNADGSFGWLSKITAPNNILGGRIDARGGSVAFTGMYEDSFTVDTTTFTSAGAGDVFVLSMKASTGATNWVKSFGGTSDDWGNDVAIDGNGNVALIGAFSGRINFGNNPLDPEGSVRNAFLVRLGGNDGAPLRAKALTGAGVVDSSRVNVDAANDIYVVGSYTVNIDLQCADMLPVSQSNRSRAFLARYTQDGSCVRAMGFGATGAEVGGSSITTNSSGDIAVTGSYCGSVAFGGRTFTSANPCPATEMFAARFAASATHLSSLRSGGGGAGIAMRNDGRFFVTGSFYRLAEFGGKTLRSEGNDAFIVGFAPL